MQTVNPDLASALVAEFSGGTQPEVDMMIGIGLNKDSDAVYFQYLGEEQKPSALMLPSGNPCTRMANMFIYDIDISENVGTFKQTKLNIFLNTASGKRIMLTAGLSTIWSQCLVTSLMGLMATYSLDRGFTIDSWKGTSVMKPCFAAIRQDGQKIQDTHMYDQLREYRADKAADKVEAAMRDAVAILKQQITGGAVDETIVSVQEEATVEF